MIEPTTNKPALAAGDASTDAVTFASAVEQAEASTSKTGGEGEREITRPNTRAGAASIHTAGPGGQKNRNFFKAFFNLILIGWLGGFGRMMTGVFRKKKKD